MDLFLIILLIIACILIIKAKNETEKADKHYNKTLDNLSTELKEVKELRKQEIHNNTVILKENTKITELLKEVADLSVSCPLDSEKLILGKIIELTRDYQSKN